MGAFCCHSKLSADRKVEIGNTLFSGPYNTGRGLPQILLLGPSGSGKTTLLYSTIVSEWKTITNEIVPTNTFHYEEIIRGPLTIGVWDVSGSDAIQALWPHFYRMISFTLLVYIVSILETDLTISRHWIRRLVNEAELKHAVIIVLINRFSQAESEIQSSISTIIASLELEDVRSLLDDPERLNWYVVNVSDGESDHNWSLVINGTINRLRAYPLNF